ncbi:hypothetical protein PFFVO_01762 [Plasmodium falciparum Vietnam Oak-Knoll (FVO)]|uniref:Uncharacterized protein n=1 Tax=Plasmodium falciparum Vietnam Oak-Knoll (FVO) TaxID=1036723 RepID=A0A024V870_PLAFA|nr:hypothetical protein PFFVO_01762 [Plasmodium falciparum Vietnam Oak-Knoll (FVO)]
MDNKSNIKFQYIVKTIKHLTTLYIQNFHIYIFFIFLTINFAPGMFLTDLVLSVKSSNDIFKSLINK